MEQLPAPTKPTGIILTHDTIKDGLYVVEDPARPYDDGGYMCGMCENAGFGETLHKGKCAHLWFHDGSCIVSVGVYNSLIQAGMPNLRQTGVTHAPPPLRITRGGALNRPAQDQTNRTINILSKIPELKPIGGVNE